MEFSIEVIQESEFIPLADKASKGLLKFAAHFIEKPSVRFSKKSLVALVKESIELEDFLDDHGARGNKNWLYYGEIVASLRGFAGTAYMINHILSRLKFYNLDAKNIDAFIRDAEKRLDFLYTSILALCATLADEAHRLGLTIPNPDIHEDEFADRIVVKVLPGNRDQEEVSDIHEYIFKVSSKLIDAVKESHDVFIESKIPKKKLHGGLIPERINEETLRQLEMHVHNAQSMYDTYIQKTPLESETPQLKSLRGYISVSLHLLSIAKELTHFYERHESSIRKETTHKKIALLIKHNDVLETIVNFALYYYTSFIACAEQLTRDILAQFSIAVTASVPVPEGLGFHLRPSTLVAKIVHHYGSAVTMHVHDKTFDAASVIDIMWAGGIIKKEGIREVVFSGDQNAVNDIIALAQANYGEDTLGNSAELPECLKYLRQS
ncbi:MAG: HPr family phosphocarrier protein [Deltaproteobacteria bacterium]|nr:HPr family phosphocarrier protein [Deltaproteobacteria bacterium]